MVKKNTIKIVASKAPYCSLHVTPNDADAFIKRY